jgi:hypothetical protein
MPTGHGEIPRGGPWTRHGHPVPGVTLAGSGRPPVARCGGPGMCSTCARDAEEIRTAARRADQATSSVREGPPLPEWFRYDVLLHGRCGRTLAVHPLPHAPEIGCPFPPLPPREFRVLETWTESLGYDPASGDVVLERYTDGSIRVAVEVRKQLEEEAVLDGVVAELRRRGWTVTEP